MTTELSNTQLVSLTKNNFEYFLAAAKRVFPPGMHDEVEFSYRLAVTDRKDWPRLRGWGKNEFWAKDLKPGSPKYFGVEVLEGSDKNPDAGKILASSGYYGFSEGTPTEKEFKGTWGCWTVTPAANPEASRFIIDAVMKKAHLAGATNLAYPMPEGMDTSGTERLLEEQGFRKEAGFNVPGFQPCVWDVVLKDPEPKPRGTLKARQPGCSAAGYVPGGQN